MEFVGKILVLLALAGIAAIEVYHKEENVSRTAAAICTA